jgi:hypothetical protein
LITEPTLLIEPKGVNAFEVENCIHLIMAANEKWVVPAGEDERRYAVFKVSDYHRQSKAWFDPLYAEMNTGGVAAMMHDLLAYDLKGWHPRDDVPQNAALHEQKLLSLSPEKQWWLDFIRNGELPKSSDMGRLLVVGSYLYENMRATVPALKLKSDHVLSEILTEGGCNRDSDYRIAKKRAWQLPPLEAARAEWDRKMGRVTEWVGAEKWVVSEEWDLGYGLM